MKRKFALISEHASPLDAPGGVDFGGQNVYVGQVARQLRAGGHQVDIFTRRANAGQPDIADWHGARVIHLPAGPAQPIAKEDLLPHMPEFTRALLRHCRREGYDVLHANFWMSAQAAAQVKRATGTPFVVTFHALGRVRRLHQGAADRFPDERFAIEERVVAEADCVVAECPQDFEDLVTLYGADPERLRIVPCGFDPDELWPIEKAFARRIVGVPTGARVLLQLGRMVPRKGVDTAIRAVALLAREHGIRATLLIIGGETDAPDPAATPEIARLHAIAREEGVEKSIVFAGRRERAALKYYYSAADAFITTPLYEPFGITPLEAMACGTPVIGSRVGGIKHTVRDGETGYLVPPADAAAVAERLALLYRNPALLDAMSRAAVEHVNQRFTWQQATAEVEALYDDVLAGRSGYRPSAEQAQMIDGAFDGAARAIAASRRRLPRSMAEAADCITSCFESGGKVLMCGNGGSAADAQHFAAEFVGRFKRPGRAALPAIALTADSAMLTAWSNDAGFEDVFGRQVEALGRPGDVLVAITTSGRSPNVVRALQEARARGLRSIVLTGDDGGDAAALADVAITVPSADTQHIQEAHIVVIHALCDLVESIGLARHADARKRVRPASNGNALVRVRANGNGNGNGHGATVTPRRTT